MLWSPSRSFAASVNPFRTSLRHLVRAQLQMATQREALSKDELKDAMIRMREKDLDTGCNSVIAYSCPSTTETSWCSDWPEKL